MQAVNKFRYTYVKLMKNNIVYVISGRKATASYGPIGRYGMDTEPHETPGIVCFY